jgi:antitoxin component of MazEF toxin-antitoxin module
MTFREFFMGGDVNASEALRRRARRRGFRRPGFEWVERRRLTQVGGSIMVALPPRLVAQLNSSPGDDVFIIEVDDGILITAVDPRFEWKLERHNTLLRHIAAALKHRTIAALQKPPR